MAGPRSGVSTSTTRLTDTTVGSCRASVPQAGPPPSRARQVRCTRSLFRRFGDRNGLLLALPDDVEAGFYDAYTSGPPPLGPGVPALDRLTSFGCALIERVADQTDLGPALCRQVSSERRQTSHYGRAFRHHVTSLLREAGVVCDHTMLTHALLAFVGLGTLDHLRDDDQVSTARPQRAWADLVRRVTGADER